jgi:hypothetical protein
MLETRLWNSARNRPPELAREHPMVDSQWDYQEFKTRMHEQGVVVADLVQLGRTVLQGIRDGKFIISLETVSTGELMRRRADRIGRGELPTVPTGSAFE